MDYTSYTNVYTHVHICLLSNKYHVQTNASITKGFITLIRRINLQHHIELIMDFVNALFVFDILD